MARTKEEQYVLRLYELASKSGDLEHPMNRYQVGQAIGFSPRLVETICKELVRSNFIRRLHGDDIRLTQQGERLALLLLKG